TFVALDIVHAGEALGDPAMLGRQDVDAEETGLADRVVGARRLVDAHQDLRRLGRHRAHPRGGEPAAQLAMAGGDQGDARREVAHALLESGRIDAHGTDSRSARPSADTGNGSEPGWLTAWPASENTGKARQIAAGGLK